MISVEVRNNYECKDNIRTDDHWSLLDILRREQMIITEKGKYKVLKDLKIRNTTSIGTLTEGSIIEITQVDEMTNKVIGPMLWDWMYHDLPLEKIEY